MSNRRGYGAGAIEDANERLHKKKAIRRQQGRARAPAPPDQEEVVKKDLAKANQDLVEARRRREILEAELEETKKSETHLENKKKPIIERIENIRKIKKEKLEKEQKR